MLYTPCLQRRSLVSTLYGIDRTMMGSHYAVIRMAVRPSPLDSLGSQLPI